MILDIKALLKSVNTKEATGPENIYFKIVKLSAKVMDSRL